MSTMENMLYNVLKEQFYLVLNQFVHVCDASGDTSPIIIEVSLETSPT